MPDKVALIQPTGRSSERLCCLQPMYRFVPYAFFEWDWPPQRISLSVIPGILRSIMHLYDESYLYEHAECRWNPVSGQWEVGVWEEWPRPVPRAA